MLLYFLIDLFSKIIEEGGKGIAFLVLMVFLWGVGMLAIANLFFKPKS